MRYFGGKSRISKPLSEYLNSILKDEQAFVDLFCGSCNVVSKIDSNRARIANDKHPYLIEMWKALQQGWIPPDNISEDDYKRIKMDTEDPALYGFVGFGLSFSGKWWGGYCRGSADRNYSMNAKNTLAKKMKTMNNVIFSNLDYQDLTCPEGSLIYCDIPYKNTTQYNQKLLGVFDHEAFYEWCKLKTKQGFIVVVSEYLENLPECAEVIWKYQSKKDIRDKDGLQQPTTEILFTFN